jgi:hypothetical protein
MLQKYTQTTYETCLACCLLQAVARKKILKINQMLELDCIVHSMKFSKADFVSGHLDYIAKKFNVKIRRLVENELYFNFLNKIKTSSKIKTEMAPINLKLIDSLLQQRDFPIIYIDAFYLFKVIHSPHFITVLGKKDSIYRIFDTWDGKEKLIDMKVLAKAISALKNHIKLGAQILIV